MTVAFLVNGPRGSAAAMRAERIAGALDTKTALVLRRQRRAADAARFLSAAAHAELNYCVDLAVVPVASAAPLSWKAPFVVDTGDAPSDFLKQVGAGRARVGAARRLEAVGYGRAARIVVRGSRHKTQLQRTGYDNITVVPDGVDLDVFKPIDDPDLRRQLGLDGVFTVGIQGHFTWYPSLGGGLGGELLRAIAERPDLPLHAVIIGYGAGIPQLRLLASQLEVADRLHVLGRVPYHDLPRYLGLCDVCLLTQTNDPSSHVRTTGKLPGYLATGRYILASRVGSVADLLPEEMLIDYHGTWDPEYPKRLAEALAGAFADPDRGAKGLALQELARRFDYTVVARQAAAVVTQALNSR